MKTLISLLILTALLPLSPQAQEHTGHGRRHRPQQQQQQMSFYQRKVVDGDEARKIAGQLAGEGERKWTDWSDRCSQPVLRIDAWRSNSVCFDRGTEFTRGSRFKCYVETEKTVSGFRHWTFDVLHNSCGGDGIHPIRKKQK